MSLANKFICCCPYSIFSSLGMNQKRSCTTFDLHNTHLKRILKRMVKDGKLEGQNETAATLSQAGMLTAAMGKYPQAAQMYMKSLKIKPGLEAATGIASLELVEKRSAKKCLWKYEEAGRKFKDEAAKCPIFWSNLVSVAGAAAYEAKTAGLERKAAKYLLLAVRGAEKASGLGCIGIDTLLTVIQAQVNGDEYPITHQEDGTDE